MTNPIGISERIQDFVQLGKIMYSIGHGKSWPGFELGVTQDEYDALNEIIVKHKHINGWFEEDQIRHAFSTWGEVLTEQKIGDWLKQYDLSEDNIGKKIGVIMAGNIPLVGFHDFLTVLISGHSLVGKLSRDADKLMPALTKILVGLNASWSERVEWKEGKLEGYDAVIATGSNNSARYFEYYFRDVPKIIRKNRSGVAVLSGDESKEELKRLGNDVFQYYGLGCRNVSKIFVPEDFVLDRFFEAIYDFNDIVNHNKYANNFDYNRAIYLMNQDPFLENGFVIMKEDELQISSPVGVIYYERYSDEKLLNQKLEDRQEEIQCVISKSSIAFGSGQKPQLEDYADGVDTMEFVSSL